MDPSRGDSRYNLNYSMSSIGLSLADQADLYGNPAAAAALGGRPPSGGLIQTMGGSGGIGLSGRSSGGLMSNSAQCQSLSNSTSNSAVGPSQQQQQQQQQQSRGIKRTNSDCYDDHHRGVSSGSMAAQMQGLESCSGSSNNQQQQSGSNVPDVVDDNYNSMQNKKSPPANGKKTKGRVKIKMEYIDNKLRRYTTFSKRKTGIMKKAYELSTLTGTQVMLLVASETGHVYTFATRKLQPMITSEAGKQLIQTCLNSPDPPSVGGGDQRMSATGFEETELSYNIADEDSKDERSSLSSPNDSDESSDVDSPLVDASQISNTFKVSGSNPTKPETASVSLLNGQAEQGSMQKQFDSTIKTTALSTQLEVGNSGNKTPAIAPRPSAPATEISNQNNVMYSSPSLSSIPQEVLLQLIQSGHLQLHTEDDGSGHQYITIPLPMPSSAPSTTSGYRSIANNALATTTSFDYNDASSKPTIFNDGGTTATQSTHTSTLSGDLNIKQELMD